MQLRTVAAGLALALPLLTGACVESDRLVSPATAPENAIFARYVAMGNSITAGFQSAGINDSTQQLSYAALVARASGFPYYYASMQGRGCPPPFVNNVTQERVGGGTSGTCDVRAPDHHPWLSNVAVPGATSFSPVDNLSPGANSNALTTFILGGRTQVQAMQDAEPTLVSAWIGNNDVLGSVTSSINPGDPALVTPQIAFEANYDAMLDAIEATGASAVLVSVAQVAIAPFTSSGATYWCLKTGLCPGVPASFPPNFLVDVSCAPSSAVPTSAGENILVPWTKGIVRLLTAAQDPLNDYTLDCTVDADVVTPTELANLAGAVTGYNTYIAAQAAARGMAYVDVNPTLIAAKQDQASGRVLAFPDVSAVGTGGSVGFGSWFSLDGVHPSAEAHGVVADLLAEAINVAFGTAIPVPVPR